MLNPGALAWGIRQDTIEAETKTASDDRSPTKQEIWPATKLLPVTDISIPPASGPVDGLTRSIIISATTVNCKTPGHETPLLTVMLIVWFPMFRPCGIVHDMLEKLCLMHGSGYFELLTEAWYKSPWWNPSPVTVTYLARPSARINFGCNELGRGRLTYCRGNPASDESWPFKATRKDTVRGS